MYATDQFVSPGKAPNGLPGQLLLPDEYADRIERQWRNVATATFDLALLCAEANESLNAAQKKTLIEQLPFNQPTFSKLAALGSDKRLQREDMRAILPPHYTVNYP